MKKLLILLCATAIMSISAQAYGFLKGEQNNGLKKICFYSDGSAITVSGASLCPLSVD